MPEFFDTLFNKTFPGFEPRNCDWFCEKLRNREPLAFARYGDGEWNAILGVEGKNCDGHEYSEQLKIDLSRVLESKPKYLLGMQGYAWRLQGDLIVEWLSKKALCDKELHWTGADVFHRASGAGKLDSFIEVIRTFEKPIFVGPPYIAKLRETFPSAVFIAVPPKNCHAQVRETISKIWQELVNVSSPRFVSISASMSANFVVDVLYNRLVCGGDIPLKHFLFDLGSLWDPYCGKRTRNYHAAVLDRLRGSS